MHIHRKFCFHFFSRSYALFELRNLAKMQDTTVFLVSATPLKPLNRISWNSVVIKDIMCRCAYPQEILIPLFSRSYALVELRNLVKMTDTTVFLVSATPLKSLNRITWNFVVMKDILCRCAYPQEILISFFLSELRFFFNFEIWWKWKILLKQLVSATPLKPLNRISWNFVVMKDIMCTGRCAYPKDILIQFFFLGAMPLFNFEIWRKWKILLKQLDSTTPLKPLNRIEWNFVFMKEIMCRYAFLQVNADLILLRGNLHPLFCPIARHLCLELPFIVYSILKQCWSVGYVSLLTLSFICLIANWIVQWSVLMYVFVVKLEKKPKRSMDQIAHLRQFKSINTFAQNIYNDYSIT